MGATRRGRKAQADCIGKPTRRQLCGVPVGSFRIYRPESAQTLELCHLRSSNSEIGICVAPSIKICGVPLHGGYAALLHKHSRWKVCSQKRTLLKMDSQRVLGPSSFGSLVFPKQRMLTWSCEALCKRVQGWRCFKAGKVDVKKKPKLPKQRLQGWWCFKAGKVDVKKKPKLPKATQKLEVSWSSIFCGNAMWPMSLSRWNGYES